MQDINPYTPPESEPLEPNKPESCPFELADRGARLGASLLDALVLLVPWSLIAWACYSFFGWRFWEVGNGFDGFFANTGILVAGTFLYLAINGLLLARNGQTIGKRILNIKIIKQDGSVPTLWDSFFKRYLLITVASNIPIAGGIFSILNPLMIFRESRKCLHDDFAGTIVIKAMSLNRQGPGA